MRRATKVLDMKTYLNDNWQYFKTWQDGILDGSADAYEVVRLPHTNAVTPFNCFDESIYQFVSGYSRVLHLDEVVGKYLVTFEGIAHYSEVYVNGQLCATHNCGYTAFTVDITEHLKVGDNLLCVKADARESLNQPPFGFVIDYLTYGGMYREVYLEHFCGTFISDAFVNAEPDRPLKVAVTLAEFASPVEVLCEVLEGDKVVFSKTYDVTASQFEILEQLQLKLWSVDSPNLYTLRLTVCGNVWQTNFGVHKAEFTKNGFYINGKRLKIVGLNRHQCFPYVGYAMPESMQRRDAQLLKNKLCVNAVRTSHYPQSQYFLDECDRLGLLVFTEIPGWQHIGDENWKKQALTNVKDMIVQNRNHPSVILWGVRINESLDCDQLYTKTNALAHKLDPTRQTGGVRYFTHSHLLEDVYTFNDFNRAGATDRANVCDTNAPYLVTEYNGHMFPTKSYDDFPHQREHVLRYARMLNGVYSDDNVSGAFGWCMFDYNTHKDFGSGDRVCYHGVCDMFRNPKLASSVFSSRGNEPVLEVAFTTEIGDYPEGDVGEMYCLTNADCVDVFKGETFLKRYTHADSPFKNMPNPPILMEYIDLQHNWGSAASALTIKAYKDGKLFAAKTIGSANKWHLEVQVSHTTLHENTTYDVAAINFRLADQNGNTATFANKIVHLEVSGAVELIGPKAFALMGGMGGTFVKTTGKKGAGKLLVDGQTIEFTVE